MADRPIQDALAALYAINTADMWDDDRRAIEQCIYVLQTYVGKERRG